MTAPDKIYLHKIRDEESSGYHKMWFETRARLVPSQEYIRKDALLEWARNMYEKTMTFVSGDSERDNEIQKFALRIVKHIESL